MLTRVPLTCGHERRVEATLAAMICAGHITTQSCHTCGTSLPVVS